MNIITEKEAFTVKHDGKQEIMSSYGEFAEERFLSVCIHSFGLVEVSPENVGKVLKHDAIVRAKEITDYEEGIDFYIYQADKNKWSPIDITVSNDTDVLETKRKKEETRGIKILKLSDADLRASVPSSNFKRDVDFAKEACMRIGRDLLAVLNDED